jgi:hypothetical protein
MLAAIGSQRNSWLRFIAFLLAIALLAQSYLVQSHVHATFGLHDAVTSSTGSAGDSPADCPLCQADMLTGVYVAPSVPEIPAALAYAWAKSLVSVNWFYFAERKHSWQSRAPPLS